MGRTIGAIVAGVVVWGFLWNAGTIIAEAMLPYSFTDPITSVPLLLGLIAYSAVLSVGAGWITAVVKGAQPMGAVQGLATANLTIGIVVEVSYWSLMPVWYHLIFLALVVPMTLVGGRIRVSQLAEEGLDEAAA